MGQEKDNMEQRKETKMNYNEGITEISTKIDDITLAALLEQAEGGSGWARRAAWAKIMSARTVLRNHTWCMIAGDDTVAKLRRTINGGVKRLEALAA